MKQATKLVSGEGVPHPRANAVFMEDRPVSLGWDFLTLIDEAQEWEDENGEDYGHGWLLRHPIKKLHLFQAFVANKKGSVKTKSAETNTRIVDAGTKKRAREVTEAADEISTPEKPQAAKKRRDSIVRKPAQPVARKEKGGKARRTLEEEPQQGVKATVVPSDPYSVLNEEIEIFWPKPYNAWFKGEVCEYFPEQKEYKVLYEEASGETSWDLHRLHQIKWKKA